MSDSNLARIIIDEDVLLISFDNYIINIIEGNVGISMVDDYVRINNSTPDIPENGNIMILLCSIRSLIHQNNHDKVTISELQKDVNAITEETIKDIMLYYDPHHIFEQKNSTDIVRKDDGYIKKYNICMNLDGMSRRSKVNEYVIVDNTNVTMNMEDGVLCIDYSSDKLKTDSKSDDISNNHIPILLSIIWNLFDQIEANDSTILELQNKVKTTRDTILSDAQGYPQFIW